MDPHAPPAPDTSTKSRRSTQGHARGATRHTVHTARAAHTPPSMHTVRGTCRVHGVRAARVVLSIALVAATAVAGTVGAAPPRPALARPVAPSPPPPPRPGPTRHVVTADDGHPLTVWEKRPAAPRRTILLLHGRTWSALPDFDLQVPGRHASLMDALVARGYAVYALDARGYGATPRDSSGWLTPDRAAADVITAARWIAKTSGVAGPPVLFGWSFGSITAQLAAQRAPDAASALVLFGHFTFPAPQPPDTSYAPPPRAATTAAAAGEDFITPAATDPAVRDAYVRAALQAQPIKPDWRHLDQFNALDPAAVHVPTLEIMGERDPISARVPEGEALFFGRLGTGDREFVVLPGVDHAAFLENQEPRFVEALVDFLDRPHAQPAPPSP